MKFIKSIILRVKLWYYTLAETLDNELDVDLTSIPQRVQQKQNSKLYRGVKRINEYLRSLSPEERLKVDNLVGSSPRIKSPTEKLSELRVQEKLLNSPTLTTDDDLVNLVVKKAPIYALEQEVKTIRRAMTACLRSASLNPSDPSHTADMKLLKAKMNSLKASIAEFKGE